MNGLRGSAAGPALVLMLVAAAPAAATDRFVKVGGSDLSNTTCASATPCLTVQKAFDNAVDGDRVVIGPGTFAGHPATTKNVAVVGAGTTVPNRTVLAGDDGSSGLHLQGGGSVSSVVVHAATGSGLLLDSTTAASPALTYDVAHVVVSGTPPCGGCFGSAVQIGPNDTVPNRQVTATVSDVDIDAAATVGLMLRNPGATATISDVSVLVENGPASGIYFLNGSDGSVTDATVTGSAGTGITVAGGPGTGPAAPERSLVTINRARVDVGNTALTVSIGDATVTDSLLVSRGGQAAFVRSLGNSDGIGTASFHQSTLYAESASGPRALLVSDNGAKPATASLVGTVARAVLTGSGAAAADLEAFNANASITAGHSAFTTAVTTGTAPAGAVPAPGSATNLMGDPLFAAPASGDFRLQPASPLIDASDAAALTAGETDATGGARSLDGSGDCTAAPDIGAFEAPAVACPPATPPAGGGGGGPSVPADTTAPMLSEITFAPATFRVAAATAAAAAKRPRGSRIHATVSEASTITVTLRRCLNRRCTKRRGAGRVSYVVGAGRLRLAFSGRVGPKARALPAGRYRATAVARDAAGNASQPATASFRIVQR